MKAVNCPPDSVINVAERVDVTLGEWAGKVDFIVVWIDDYEAVLGMEFMKQFEAMVVPHMKKLYIYDGREGVPISVPTVGVTKAECKLTAMNMEDDKRDEEVYKRLSSTETKLMEQSQIIQTFSDSILDLSRRLEVVEIDEDEDEDARSNVQMEVREAYL